MSRPITAGDRFGRLVVTAYVGQSASCLCDCGAMTDVRGDHLRSGETRSCGCLRRDVGRAVGAMTTHGHARGGGCSPEYSAWCAMVQRCTVVTTAGYENYGGRGIAVCDRWRESFEAFLADMGKRTSPRHSLDRINNDGNYEPGNCRWATAQEQRRNTRQNRVVEFRGESMPLVAWAERIGIHPATLKTRLDAWPVERALTTPRLRNRAHQ